MSKKPPDEQQDIAIQLRADRNQDLQCYNLPTANNEVAIIIPGDGSEEQSNHRDIVIRLNSGGLCRISQLHPSYASLHYVMLFPHGEDGWHTDIPTHQTADGRRRAPNVTQRCYYSYRLHPWLRDIAMGDHDENINLAEHGSHIIVPSTHVCSDRYMGQLFQDFMAICRAFQKPDLFLTMTANPNWPEIQDALLEEKLPDPTSNTHRRKQIASDRPDIVACVFEQKKNALLKDIRGGALGKVVANIHTIEFQKRGLPHMHLLIFLDPTNKIHNAHDIDSIVSAQIPDPVTQPLLYETVTNCMVHGPCGNIKPKAKCMVDKKCSK
jgi:hypothetical protein